MHKIIDIKPSPRMNKRLRVILSNGKHYDFGQKDGSTYIDHKDKVLKYSYINRHMGNNKERELIENLEPSPALFSYYLLYSTKFLNNFHLKKN